MTSNAIILLSGGLDSATVLAMAAADGYETYALSFDYDQRHRVELQAAKAIATASAVAGHAVVKIDLAQFGGSALTDMNLDVPIHRSTEEMGSEIPITYVPARNTIFLSYALAWAEVLPALDIFIGVNALDYSGYPDCRPEFIEAFELMANRATQAGVSGSRITIHAPLMDMNKGQIIRRGRELGVEYGMTTSCYNASGGRPCGVCDACLLRAKGFADAGIADPALLRVA